MAVTLVRPFFGSPMVGAGLSASAPGIGWSPEVIVPESPLPVLIVGTGAPDGDASPFLEANKGSVYLQMDATDDAAHMFVKFDEGGDDADWTGPAA